MFYATDSTEEVTKPRTKQTARMSTGGIAPRKRVMISTVPGTIAMLFKY